MYDYKEILYEIHVFNVIIATSASIMSYVVLQFIVMARITIIILLTIKILSIEIMKMERPRNDSAEFNDND